jgi:UDP-glucose 4-epimerase
MVEHKVVLVTGVAGRWGAQVAARLAREPVYHVIGLDITQPERELKELDFILADPRDPALAELLQAEGVDTVCHLAFVDTIHPNQVAFDLNVNGTKHLLEACAEAGVRKVVLKSSMDVYGARPGNSAFLSENHPLRGSRTWGGTRDRVEIETFCDSFRHQAPNTLLTILRFAHIIGPTADTPMTRFLSEPWAPSLLGFDPRMQLIHEEDVVAALLHAVYHDVRGVFNVAAEDVLSLNRIRGLAGKAPLPIFHPLVYRGAGARLRLSRYVPIEPDRLRYPCVGDLRRMCEQLGFSPRYTAEEALREYAAVQRMRRLLPGVAVLPPNRERLREAIAQRRRAREKQATSAVEEGGDDE